MPSFPGNTAPSGNPFSSVGRWEPAPTCLWERRRPSGCLSVLLATGPDALIRELGDRGILIKAHSRKGVAEEAPGAYKDVEEVAAVAEAVGLSRRVARVRPIACVKG
jgi:hypothetical protein